MPSWKADQYLQFAVQRTQPARDLAARIDLAEPREVIDLGCGPGNSTEVLAARWPGAAITGLDNSAEMIGRARHAHPEWRWVAEPIENWAAGGQQFDVVFSNAALQWVPDHPRVFPQLMQHVAPGGALAVQMPANIDAAAHTLMRGIAARFPLTQSVREWFIHGSGFYYDALAPLASRVDLWTTEYIHVMEGPEDIVEWYKGTGMRPFLDSLPDDRERTRFSSEYLEAIREAYPARRDGRVLFPFRRLFVVAYR